MSKKVLTILAVSGLLGAGVVGATTASARFNKMSATSSSLVSHKKADKKKPTTVKATMTSDKSKTTKKAQSKTVATPKDTDTAKVANSKASVASQSVAPSSAQSTAQTQKFATPAAATNKQVSSFDQLTQKQQLAMLVDSCFAYKPTGTQFDVYMPTADQFVIYDIGEGAGGWPDHAVRFTNNHNGTYTIAEAVSTVSSNAEMTSQNSYWKTLQNVSESSMVARFNQMDPSTLNMLENSFNIQSTDFPYLPINQNSVPETNGSASDTNVSAANFDRLPQNQKYALMVQVGIGSTNPNSSYAVYAPSQNQVVIYDKGEGAGGWSDHVIRVTDNGNGTLTINRPVSDTAQATAEMNKSNSYWGQTVTVSKDKLLQAGDTMGQQAVDALANAMVMTPGDFPYLPITQDTMPK
ncbi:hypothetical protein D3P96_03870 [Weissella viridescens]|uniref:Uncharacterized protein n=1 Tax=Weissella viridescens TaxID=1629 RepID=A0A3P2RBW8_WEIVI|nr:hypothetical protein [Weissella viridescens]RRG18073.1 hypothetical protein D3P96_03870 [Weissella viridescens]